VFEGIPDGMFTSTMPQYATGGYVSGPGGPTDDKIPAWLSDGEYVIKASSVKQYGTELLDQINARKFYTGGYISADRAETAAQGNVYGGKPKPQYSGGTPTYTGGYTSANTQATRRSNKWMTGGGDWKHGAGIDYPLPVYSPGIMEEFGGMWQSIRNTAASVTDLILGGVIPPWMQSKRTGDSFLDRINWNRTSVGSVIGGQQYLDASGRSLLVSMGDWMPGGGFKGGPRSAMSMAPTAGAFSSFTPPSKGTQLSLFGLEGLPLSASPVKRGPAPGTTISIGRGIRGATGILESGKFKNMFETETTTGSVGVEDRASIESRGWGIPYDAPASDRPIYGLLRDSESVSFPYGEVLFDIKYDPSKRTSYSPMDTKWASIPEGGLPDLKQSHGPGEGNIGYAEVWQNNVGLKDIQTAHFAITDTMSDASVSSLIQLAKRYSQAGIPVKIHNLETNLPFGQWTHRRRGQMFLPGMEGVSPVGDALMANGGLVRKLAEGGLVRVGRENLSVLGEGISDYAKRFVGTPYSSGAAWADGPANGWGCATATKWLYDSYAGVDVGHPSLSASQYSSGAGSRVNNMLPGDLLFFYYPNGVNTSNPINHVGMALGNGSMFHARSEALGTQITGIDGAGMDRARQRAGGSAIKRYLPETIAGMGIPTAKFKMGGKVYGKGGPTSDDILALISNGEYVMNASAVSHYGKDFMDAVNKGILPEAAMGGMFSSKYPGYVQRMGDGGMLSRKFGMNNDSSPISNVEYNINVNVAGTNSSPDDIAEAVMKSLKRKERMVGAVTRV
jgi:hypothetical protein